MRWNPIEQRKRVRSRGDLPGVHCEYRCTASLPTQFHRHVLGDRESARSVEKLEHLGRTAKLYPKSLVESSFRRSVSRKPKAGETF